MNEAVIVASVALFVILLSATYVVWGLDNNLPNNLANHLKVWGLSLVGAVSVGLILFAITP